MEMIAHQGIGQYLHPGHHRRNGDIDKCNGALFVAHENHARLQGLRMQVEEGAFFPEQPFQFPFIPPRWRTSYLFHQHKHNGRYAECQYPPNNFLCFWCRFIVFDEDCRPIVRKRKSP